MLLFMVLQLELGIADQAELMAKWKELCLLLALRNMLTAVELNKDNTWQQAIGDLQLSLNCTMNRVTKSSPLRVINWKSISSIVVN